MDDCKYIAKHKQYTAQYAQQSHTREHSIYSGSVPLAPMSIQQDPTNLAFYLLPMRFHPSSPHKLVHP